MVPDDHTCTQCKKRRVEHDQVGEKWRVCPRCQVSPHLNDDELLARKLGMISAEVTKEKKVSIEINWFPVILMTIMVIGMGFILTGDWNLSSDFKATMADLIIAIIPILIIMTVFSYVIRSMGRMKL